MTNKTLRDALEEIKGISQNRWTTFHSEVYDIACTALREAEAGEGWHKWPDEKPEGDGVNCLVWLSNDTIFIGEWFTYPDEFWNDPRTNQDFDSQVVGWQPLPDLPKEGE